MKNQKAICVECGWQGSASDLLPNASGETVSVWCPNCGSGYLYVEEDDKNANQRSNRNINSISKVC